MRRVTHCTLIVCESRDFEGKFAGTPGVRAGHCHTAAVHTDLLHLCRIGHRFDGSEETEGGKDKGEENMSEMSMWNSWVELSLSKRLVSMENHFH